MVILDTGFPDLTLKLVLLEQEVGLRVLQLTLLYTHEVYLCNLLIIPIFSPVVTISDQGVTSLNTCYFGWNKTNSLRIHNMKIHN